MSTPYNKGKQQVCRNFLNGTCTRRNCPFQHPRAGGGGGGGGGGGKPAAFANSQILVTALSLLLDKAQHDVYSPAEKRLVISNFRSSPDTKAMTSSIDFNTATFCDALCTAIADKIGPTGVTILDVSSNEIRTLTHLANAMKKHNLHTNLAGLSAENNQITSTDFATSLQAFPNLQQLVLSGNPVANNADYRQTVRKRLPHLVGLDKTSIERPPLGLPWPSPDSAATQPGSDVVAFLASYFSALSTGGLDAVVDWYHPHAVFSLSFANEQATVKWDASSADASSSAAQGGASPGRRPLPSKDVLRDVTALRVKQSEGNHNVMRGLKKENIARGRVEVISKLSHLIYQRSFVVEHQFANPINCSLIRSGPSVPHDLALASIHGRIIWRHRSSEDVSFTRMFDRSMTVVPNTTGSGHPFLIAADAFELRPQSTDALFFANAPDRVNMVARKYGVPPEVAVGCASLSARSDISWMALLSEIQSSVPISLLEAVAVQMGSGDIPRVINVARLMARRQIGDVAQAAAMLDAAGGNVDAVQ